MNIKKIAYSILELAAVPEGSSVQEVFKNSVLLAQKADDLGFTRMWFAEHHNMAAVASSAPQILIGHIAAATQRLRVGSGGIMLPNHSPLIIAEQFGTLANLFPGRIDLGLGRAPGTDQVTARAIKPGFIEAAHSFPDDIKKIQTYFSSENSTAQVRTALAEGTAISLFILGSSTNSASLAAQKGLPYAFASHFSTAQFFDALHIYRSNFKPSEVLEKPYILAGANVIIADTDEEAERLYTSNLKMVIAILSGTRDQLIAKPTAMTPELKEIRKHPAIAQMTKYSFVGSKETVKKQTQQFLEETQIDEIIISSTLYHTADRLKSIQLFSEIMNELNES